jgi:phosphoglycerol transferase MdoB-like AlkP superfamily enzyme
VQTSSSHEPFDVPYNKLSDERLNAFAYADHCVGEFVKKLRASNRWKRSLVVIVPDHLGCYPPHISNYDFSRYEIPLILVGGVVKEPRTIDVVGSQHDLAATLLSQLGIAHEEFLFSKDMLHSGTPHFAFFTVPDAFGIVNEDGRLIFDNKSQKVVAGDSNNDALLKKGKAYLQKLYDDIEKR